MAVHYATYIYNHLPKTPTGMAPIDLFHGSVVARTRLRHLHVWGCPAYVLHPTLADGNKLPRWSPKSKQGIFVGFSRVHSSDVPLVLNQSTGAITPVFHAVMDDHFSTVCSIATGEEPPNWKDLCETNVLNIPVESDKYELDSVWLTPEEQNEQRVSHSRTTRIWEAYENNHTLGATEPAPMKSRGNTEPTPDAATIPEEAPDNVPPPPTPPTEADPPNPDPPAGPRRSARSNKGQRTTPRYEDDFIHLAKVGESTTENDVMAYMAAVQTEYHSGDMGQISDARVYAAAHHKLTRKKRKKPDPDMPSLYQIKHRVDLEKWIEAMRKEVIQLVGLKTWEKVPRPKHEQVIPVTWVLKLKRLPDLTPYKYKARLCVRGDLEEDVDCFDTYAPVVQWSSIRMVLTIPSSRPNGPKRNMFFDKLAEGLTERGWKQSEYDRCFFMKKDMVCVVWVDDTIFAGPDINAINKEIDSLRVPENEEQHKFTLRDEGEVGNFLGIQIEKKGDKEFYLSQPGLIQKILTTSGMENCKKVDTPAEVKAIGKDINGKPFDEEWDYASVVGMLMFLGQNTRPDCTFAINQVARFTHDPKQSHGEAVKRIIRYLKGTADKGMSFSPNGKLEVDCWVDADFAGLYGAEDDQDPTSVKSRTGYIIKFMGVPLVWKSALQGLVTLSTMEAEYCALSDSMRELIPIREILKEVHEIVLDDPNAKVTFKTHSKSFEDIPNSKVYEDNEACLRHAIMPKITTRTKHIAIRYHFWRTKSKELEILPIGTDEQLGDPFTKGLPKLKFRDMRMLLMGW